MFRKLSFLSLALSFVICPAAYSNELLQRWKDTKHAEEVYGTYLSYQRTELYIALRMSTFPTPDSRMRSAEERLRYIHGDAPQKIRLLLWLTETEPIIRQEYLVQWLAEKDTTPDRTGTEQTLTKILDGRRIPAIEERIGELDDVYEALPQRRQEVRSNHEAWSYQVDTLDKTGRKSPAASILDALSEELLLYADDDARMQVYEEALPPMRERNGPAEIGDSYRFQVVLGLYFRESDIAILQYLKTELVDATNVYNSDHVEPDEDPIESEPPPPTALELEYEESEWKRRREIGILDGVTIPREHTENCCELCDTREMTKRRREKKEPYVPQVGERIKTEKVREAVSTSNMKISKTPERVPGQIAKALPEDKNETAESTSPVLVTPTKDASVVVMEKIPSATDEAEQSGIKAVVGSSSRFLYGLAALGAVVVALVLARRLVA